MKIIVTLSSGMRRDFEAETFRVLPDGHLHVLGKAPQPCPLMVAAPGAWASVVRHEEKAVRSA